NYPVESLNFFVYYRQEGSYLGFGYFFLFLQQSLHKLDVNADGTQRILDFVSNSSRECCKAGKAFGPPEPCLARQLLRNILNTGNAALHLAGLNERRNCKMQRFYLAARAGNREVLTPDALLAEQGAADEVAYVGVVNDNPDLLVGYVASTETKQPVGSLVPDGNPVFGVGADYPVRHGVQHYFEIFVLARQVLDE